MQVLTTLFITIFDHQFHHYRNFVTVILIVNIPVSHLKSDL
jgi:hypothetical protein